MLYSKVALSFACCIAFITLAGEVSDRDLRIWARNGNASAAYNLAVRALNSGNQESAVTWMHKAAKLGSNEASYQLGNFYMAGKIVTVNQETALFWYLDSAEKGNTKAHEKDFLSLFKGCWYKSELGAS
jgi:TPR repeat protein